MVEVHLYLIMFATAGMLNIYIYIYLSIEWSGAAPRKNILKSQQPEEQTLI